jgi:Predicted phosphatase homologous to the C-terminal domain of histone macroH2A1
MPLNIIRNDITKLRVDVIVNATNTNLQMDDGVTGAIFGAAGTDIFKTARNSLVPIKEGEAVITQGFGLPAKYIIHVAMPVYHDGKQGEEALLRSCYTTSLEIAVQHNCESIAFPLISSGLYGYPKAEALRIATDVIRNFIRANDIDVSLVLFDKDSLAVSEELLGEVESYIDEHYVAKYHPKRREPLDVEEALSGGEMEGFSAPVFMQSIRDAQPLSLEDLVGDLDEPFSATVMRLIDATGRSDADIYRRANIDRRLFSKIRNNADYVPSKPTVLAFAIALELTLDQTDDLLERAGFALSHSRKFDVIVEYFIEHRKYDIFEINEVLFRYDQPLLGR